MSLVKRCRHRRREWGSCRCSWSAVVGGTYHNLGTDEREARRIYNALRFGTIAAVAGNTFADAADRWLAVAEVSVRPSTVVNYHSSIRQAKRLIGHIPVSRMTAADIMEMDAALARSIGPGTRRNVRSAVGAVMRYAVSAGLIERAPDMKRSGHRLPRRVPARHLTPDEMRLVLARAERGAAELYRFMWLTGLRPGEAIGVEYDDVRGTVLEVRRQITQATGRVGPLKTPSSQREVDLSPAALSAIESAGGDGARPWPWRYAYYLTRWHGALARAEIRRCGLHALRHSNVSMRIAAGQDISYIANQVGHATPAVTLSIYSHLIPGPRQDAAVLDRLAGV